MIARMIRANGRRVCLQRYVDAELREDTDPGPFGTIQRCRNCLLDDLWACHAGLLMTEYHL
jgi:hypothetical protein